MRFFARSRAPRLRGAPHTLRSAYTNFALVEPFPNGRLYFKRTVDRPTCVYVVKDRLFILSTRPQAFAIVPTGDGCFHLARGRSVLSPGDYIDDDTCVPDAAWPVANAWECFRLDAPPKLDRADLATIAQIDRDLDVAGAPAHRADGIAGMATTGPSLALARRIGPRRRFNGSIDRCESTHAAGWSACGVEPATVTVYVNGTRIGEARPAGERPDVAAAGYARYSAWSFGFPRPIAAGDRVAFRFPDGSPMRAAAAAYARRGVVGTAGRRGLLVPV